MERKRSPYRTWFNNIFGARGDRRIHNPRLWFSKCNSCNSNSKCNYISLSIPISYYSSRYGLDIDLLTSAGFGYLGSTITSLIYASFTFIFLALEATIMALALELCIGMPLHWGYLVSTLLVIPIVTYGISTISRFQLWTQPIWMLLQLLPIVIILLMTILL